jgi:hypothetical protein
MGVQRVCMTICSSSTRAQPLRRWERGECVWKRERARSYKKSAVGALIHSAHVMIEIAAWRGDERPKGAADGVDAHHAVVMTVRVARLAKEC